MSMSRRIVLLLVSAALLTGCAGMNRPRTYVYPAQGQDAGRQAEDQVVCEQWAREQTGYDATGNAVVGAVGGSLAGATIGALLGAIICAPIRASGTCAAMGAALGGVRGGVEGAVANMVGGREEFSQAYGVCMVAMGYSTGGAYVSVPVSLLPAPEAQPQSLSQPGPPPPPPSPPVARRTDAPLWCRGDNQEWLGAACLTRAKEN
jgi:hypothetical protein